MLGRRGGMVELLLLLCALVVLSGCAGPLGPVADDPDPTPVITAGPDSNVTGTAVNETAADRNAELAALEAELRDLLQNGGEISPERYKRIQEELDTLEREGVNVSFANDLFQQLSRPEAELMAEQLNVTCPNVTFTEYFIDPEYVVELGQIGVVHGSGSLIVGRSYVFTEEGVEGEVPVYAPTDMVLVAGSQHDNPTPGALPDHTLTFDAGCGVEVTFDHLKVVVPTIEDRIPVTDSTATIEVDPITFRAGERIGSWVPDEGVAAFDFLVTDVDVENRFFNEERYEESHLRHVVCPYELYTGENRAVYQDMLQNGPGGEKTCGNVSRDVPGAIEGQWFRDVDGDRYGSPLPIVETERITIGNLGNRELRWIYPNNPTYKPAAEVRGEHCYQFYPEFDQPEGYVFFKIVNNTTMDVVFSADGTCPSTYPGDGVRYYR